VKKRSHAIGSGAPSKLEVLSALLRATETNARREREERAEREARVVTSESVMRAIRQGEDTWARIHAWFPESAWPALGRELDRLQREERIHRGESLRFSIGARKHPWRIL
jgi:hypothetical protein